MKPAVDILRENGVRIALSFGNDAFEWCIFDCHDLYGTIDILKRKKRPHCNLMAHLSSNYEESFALLYDFVDAFLISEFDDLDESVDPLVRLRLYNDEYKQIFLKIPDNFLNEELDEVISYSLLSNIDGLVISNQRLMAYAVKKSNSMLQIIAGETDTEIKFEQAKKDGADIAAIPYKKQFVCPLISWYFAKRWIRKSSQLSQL